MKLLKAMGIAFVFLLALLGVFVTLTWWADYAPNAVVFMAPFGLGIFAYVTALIYYKVLP